MPPVVTEIVNVDQRIAFRQKHLANRHPAFVHYLDIVIVLAILMHSPIFAALLKMMQMAICPVHDRLKCVMQATQQQRARYLDAPPDGRFDAEEVIFNW